MAEARFRACAICGKVFRLRGSKALCCSTDCKNERRRRYHRSYYPQYWIDHPGQFRETYNAYRAGPAMPPWVDRQELARFYAKRPEGKIVDHIIPLARPKFGYSLFEGRPVCGLHVIWNLQYLTYSEDHAKRDESFERKRIAASKRANRHDPATGRFLPH